MNQVIWIFTVASIPLLMMRNLIVLDFALNYLFVGLTFVTNMRGVIRGKLGFAGKVTSIFLIGFFIISLFDVLRFEGSSESLAYPAKILVALLVFRTYSEHLIRYGFSLFIKVLMVSSTVVVVLMLKRSLIDLRAPFFVVSGEDIITEMGKNQMAFYLSFVITVLMWVWQHHLKFFTKGWKVVVIVSVFVHIFAGVYVQSRGLVLAVIGGQLALYIIVGGLRGTLSGVAKLAFVGVVVGAIVVGNRVIDLGQLVAKTSVLIDGRIAASGVKGDRNSLLEKAVDYFFDNVVIGIGSNNFAVYEELATHNTYIQVLAENGVIGLIFFSIMWIVLAMKIYDRRLYPEYGLMVCLFASWALYIAVINALVASITLITLALIVSLATGKVVLNEAK